jgi:uncharacterized protein
MIHAVTVKDRLRRVAAAYRLDAIYAFGSRAGEAVCALPTGVGLAPANASDLDIGVLPQIGTNLDAAQRVSLMSALEDVFAVGRVDLVILPEASPFLAADVVSGELLFARDADREAEYQLYVLRRAGDLAPFERERQAIVLGGGR